MILKIDRPNRKWEGTKKYCHHGIVEVHQNFSNFNFSHLVLPDGFELHPVTSVHLNNINNLK